MWVKKRWAKWPNGNAKKVESKMGRTEHPSKISIENFFAQCRVCGHGFSSYEKGVVFEISSHPKRPIEVNSTI